MTIRQGVPLKPGIFVALEKREDRLQGTVIEAQEGNILSQIYHGTVGEALRRAKEVSLAAGFDGYFDVRGSEEIASITPSEYAEAASEIAEQTTILLPTAGASWGAISQYSDHQLDVMPPAQAQVRRLSLLSDALKRALKP
jgi:hypothetical protein